MQAGEVLGLLGPNGAGKSTALGILCGLLVPAEGKVFVAGIDVCTDPLGARRQLAYVPEGAPLYRNLSARRHLELVGRLHGHAEGTLRASIDRLLGSFGILERADDPVGTFSRGMRQRAAIACALLARPRLLLLDEPLSGLDAPTAATIKELLRAFARQTPPEGPRAVLVTSHLLDVVERVCDRMAILDAGRLLALGSLADLSRQAGQDGSLEEVFGALTSHEDPASAARRILQS